MNSRLERVTDWVSMSRNARYHVASLATLCSVSRRELERFFHERFRVTTHAWLSRLQLEEAAARLESGQTVKACATDVGFKNCSSFCRKFKGRYGVSPATFAARSHGMAAYAP